MAEEHPMMVGAATVFVVSDAAASSITATRLASRVTFEYGTPTFYAYLCRDEVALHLPDPRDQAATGQRRHLRVRPKECR